MAHKRLGQALTHREQAHLETFDEQGEPRNDKNQPGEQILQVQVIGKWLADDSELKKSNHENNRQQVFNAVSEAQNKISDSMGHKPLPSELAPASSRLLFCLGGLKPALHFLP